MPRRREVPERPVMGDPKYSSKLVTKFINAVMRDGKKSTAESLLYDAFGIIEEKTKGSPLKLFEQAVDNVRPLIEVKSRRVGGSTYQVPLKYVPRVGLRWGFDGLSDMPGNDRKRAWPESLPGSLWMPPATGERLPRKEKTPTKWRKPTRRLPISAGRAKY
jgi:ribosomal protein S7